MAREWRERAAERALREINDSVARARGELEKALGDPETLTQQARELGWAAHTLVLELHGESAAHNLQVINNTTQFWSPAYRVIFNTILLTLIEGEDLDAPALERLAATAHHGRTTQPAILDMETDFLTLTAHTLAEGFGALTASMILDVIPIIGNIKSGLELVTSRDWVADQNLDPLGRLLAGVGLFSGTLKRASKAGDIAKLTHKFSQATSFGADVARNLVTRATARTATLAELRPVREALSNAAARARATTGPPTGSASTYGTHVHAAFREEVKALGLISEISFLNGVPVRHGTPGSIREDALVGPEGNPIAIFDLKTGTSGLTPARIAEIRRHLPRPVQAAIQILEVR